MGRKTPNKQLFSVKKLLVTQSSDATHSISRERKLSFTETLGLLVGRQDYFTHTSYFVGK